MGRHAVKLDRTGRISLPGALRFPFLPGEDECVIAPLDDDHAGIWTPLSFDVLLDRLNTDETEALAHPKGSRWLAMSSHYLSIDNQFRIVIPPDIRERVDLGERIVLAGAEDRIEVWNEAKFQEKEADEARYVRSRADNMRPLPADRPTRGDVGSTEGEAK